MKEYDFLDLAHKYKDKCIKDLCEILKYDTVLDEFNPESDAPFGKGNKECLEAFLEMAKRDGFIVKNVDNYAGHIEYGEGEEILGVLGHLDVVPTLGDWHTNPFEPTIKDGRIYARGSLDDKGPVMASYYGLKILKDLGIKPNKKIRLIVGCDEESESRCLNHYFKYEKMPDMGFSPDADYPLIYGEKAFSNFEVLGKLDNDNLISWISGSRLNIVPDICEVSLKKDLKDQFLNFLKDNNYNGEVKDNKYYTYGKNAHGSTPEVGVNANFIMAEFLDMYEPSNVSSFVKKYLNYSFDGILLGIDITNGDMGHLSMNPGVFEIKDGNVYIGVDCRVPSNDHFDTIKEKLSTALKEFNLDFKVLKCTPMHYVPSDSFLVSTLYNVYKEISHDEINKPYTIGGGTYAKFIPVCVAFGPIFPGEESTIHEPNESISIDSLEKNIAIYAKSIYELVK